MPNAVVVHSEPDLIEDFEDEPTVILVREDEVANTGPVTGVVRKVSVLPAQVQVALDDDAWLATLPPATRAALQAAQKPQPRWPFAPRIAGAIAVPARTSS